MKSTFLTLLTIATFFNSFAQNKLPLFEKEKATVKADWLVDSVNAKTQLFSGENNQLLFSNGLVSRTFTTQPNCATVSLDLLTTNESFLRSVRPEAEIGIDGIKLSVGGLTGQPIHNYLLPEWLAEMKADRASFRYTGYKLEDTKARFPWKKRPEWMPVDLPWPPAGKELIFSYQLPDEAIAEIAVSDAGRPVTFYDNFDKIDNTWKRFESDADARNSFVNEGKPGEIMALANTAVYAEREISEGTTSFIAQINPGTDKSSSWGPGIGLVFGNRVVKLNLRPGKNEFGFYNEDGENVLQGMQPGNSVWLRLDLNRNKVTGYYSYNKQNWVSVGEAAVDGKPERFRVGKMDQRGRNYDNPENGEQVRCLIESVQFTGSLPSGSPEALKYSYLKNIVINIHYELYDGMPVFSKWIELQNNSSNSIKINSFKSEILALTEAESEVDMKNKWLLPNMSIVTDYNFGGMTNESFVESSIAWNTDPLYKTQVNYERKTPCLLEVYPKLGPEQEIEPGSKFTSYRVWELLHDSQVQERKGLEHRRMMRALAPWATENPILMHVRSASDDAVKKAIDQCAEVGFEMVIMTFGSGFNAENDMTENIERMKNLAEYAHSRKIALGGYSLLASRRIDEENDVVMPEGKTPRFGNSPCLESDWGQQYFTRLYNLFEKTGLDILEHDGSYPGDICISEKHPGHKGLGDSQWNQYKRISDFYKWCRAKGIYLNVPDYYYLAGSNKSGMGYRETNWSLPREQQEIIERQNVYDGTWTKTPSMGWMFVPLVEYHGGGAAATIEPLKDHLAHYEQRLANLFGAGVQACYRGPQLYDAPETKSVVEKWVSFYKKYRRILDADIIHIRRPDGRDYDAILHVDPQGTEKGLLMVYNPLNKPIERLIEIPLYYTGLKNQVQVQEQEGNITTLQVDRDYKISVMIKVPANGYNYFIFR